MKILRTIIVAFTLWLITIYVSAQITQRPRPPEWKNLVYGGRFMDRFLPMPDIGRFTDQVWGVKGVRPRYIDNGIEHPRWSFWGGNIIHGEDGKYHLYVCGWPEDSPGGHSYWGKSIVFNAVSDNSFGPFVIKDTIGRGHNPEIFRLEDGHYVIYVIGGYYISETCNGPWEYMHFEFLNRDRKIIEGLSNLTFAKREDGSFIMVCRGGGIWYSQTGISPYNQITGKSIYPDVEGNFEDPVIWRDNVQYNLIVNDWLGRIAYYERSKDGVRWKVEPGEAYLPGIARHKDGSYEDWFKYERIKIFQDNYGRATQANFAVIDTLKKLDRENDNHSSKNIVIPLTAGRLLTIMDKGRLTSQTKKVRVKISAEPGFNPEYDIDINSLSFGDPEAVNYGRGSRVLKTEKSGNDLIVTFNGTGLDFPDDEFAAKLLGKTKEGELLFGYARLPWIDFMEPILSPGLPVFTQDEKGFRIDSEVQNFGQVSSEKARLKIVHLNDQTEILISEGEIPSLQPFEKKVISLKCGNIFEKGTEYTIKVIINPDNVFPEELAGKVIPLK